MATLLGRMRHIKAYWVTGTLISLTVSAFAVVQSCLSCTTMHDTMFQSGSQRQLDLQSRLEQQQLQLFLTLPGIAPRPRSPVAISLLLS